jgi:hypothetical protein
MNTAWYGSRCTAEPGPVGVYSLLMPASTILLSFVGNRDPFVENSEDIGPVLSLLQARPFDQVVLFCTGPDNLERAKMVEEAARSFDCRSRFTFVSLELDSPIDYEEILVELGRALEELRPQLAAVQPSVLLDPGTPQMQTAWFLLAKSGVFDARLLQGIPPRFADGAYKVREVNLQSRVLPEVRMRRERESLESIYEAKALLQRVPPEPLSAPPWPKAS